MLAHLDGIVIDLEGTFWQVLPGRHGHCERLAVVAGEPGPAQHAARHG
jgi:hypothetical protein